MVKILAIIFEIRTFINKASINRTIKSISNTKVNNLEPIKNINSFIISVFSSFFDSKTYFLFVIYANTIAKINAIIFDSL